MTRSPLAPEHAAAIVEGALGGVNIARHSLKANPAALKALADGLHRAGAQVLESQRNAEKGE